MGPTACGKTDLAVEMATKFPFEIISVDSAMVYRGMDIGTAKPSVRVLNEVPHHLIDIRDPGDAYSVAEFRKDALNTIASIHQKGKIPLLVGGSMLYFRALQAGINELPPANAIVRSQLLEEGNNYGWPHLHLKLMEVDPVAAERIHPHDSQRIQRALEVYFMSGKSLTTWQAETLKTSLFPTVNLAIFPFDREQLHERIKTRFETMLKQGLLEEVETLYGRKDLTLETPAIRSVGYRQAWEHLEGKTNFQEMKERGVIATRQLAKRQMTWLRSWPDITLINYEANDLRSELFKHLNFLQK